MRVTRIFAAAAIALVSTFSFADSGAEQAIRKSLETLQLDVPVESISASPMAGLYEVKLKGSRVLYVSAQGRQAGQSDRAGRTHWRRQVDQWYPGGRNRGLPGNR